MKTRVEQLPVEIWLSIFCYFEAHELFQAFRNLNSYFDSLIASQHLSLYFRLKKSDQYDKYIFTENRLNRVVYLQSTIWSKSGDFPEYLYNYINQFIRLKSLKLHTSGSQTTIICRVLQTLQSLEYLSLRCQMTDELLHAILSAPTLRVCHLEFYPSDVSIRYDSNQSSNIQVLYVNISNESDNRILKLLLTRMSKLKRLEILNYDYNYNYSIMSFLNQSFLFPELRSFKLKWNSIFIHKHFFGSLIKKMPMLKRVYLDLYSHYLSEQFFKNLINHWWLIITEIEHVTIFIRGDLNLPKISSHGRWKTVDYYRKNLLSQNDTFDKRFKITWTQNDSLGKNYLEIVICS